MIEHIRFFRVVIHHGFDPEYKREASLFPRKKCIDIRGSVSKDTMNLNGFSPLLRKSCVKLGALLSTLLALVIAMWGCERDADIKIVDFSKTITVAQPGKDNPEQPALNVAVSAVVSPKEAFGYYHQLLDYLSKKLELRVELVQRKTYNEINELLGAGHIDVAFICSGAYVKGKAEHRLELLAAPRMQGSHFYQAYLIVQKDSVYQHLDDLKGKVFAFSDPMSNTGKLIPTYWLARRGERPETFFRNTIYTYSHDNSILAVSRGLVDAASVDGLIWDYYHSKNPSFTSGTRIIEKSEKYGIPPLVTSNHLAQDLKERIKDALFTMHQDPEGLKILNELMIDRFEQPEEDWYAGIQEMVHMTSNFSSNKSDVSKKY